MSIETSTADIIAAASDGDLLRRLIATAARNGIPNPQAHVEARMMHLVSQPLDDQGNTLASVYAYARATMPPAPGANPAAVTDVMLGSALAAVPSN